MFIEIILKNNNIIMNVSNNLKTFIKEYDLKELLNNESIKEIKENTIKRIDWIHKDNIKFKENLNNTNEFLWDKSAQFWFEVEEILWFLDNKLERNEKETWQKYDFKTKRFNNDIFIDVKSFKTSKEIETIIERNFKWYLQFEQILLSCKYCFDNKIDLKDFYFEIVYWDGNMEIKLYRLFHKNLNLEYIVTNYIPKFENPVNTNWNNEQVLNYVIDLVQKNKENNIII